MLFLAADSARLVHCARCPLCQAAACRVVIHTTRLASDWGSDTRAKVFGRTSGAAWSSDLNVAAACLFKSFFTVSSFSVFHGILTASVFYSGNRFLTFSEVPSQIVRTACLVHKTHASRLSHHPPLADGRSVAVRVFRATGEPSQCVGGGGAGGAGGPIGALFSVRCLSWM